MGHPAIEFAPAGDEELQVVKPNVLFVEAIAAKTWATHKAELETSNWLSQGHLQCAIWGLVPA